MIEIVIVKYNQPLYEHLTVKSILNSVPGLDYSLTAYQNKPGVGLAKVWNRLIDKSDAEYIVLLNNDVQVTRHWLARLHSTFEDHENVGMVQPSSNDGHKSTISPGPLSTSEKDWTKINEFGQEVYRQRRGQVQDVDVSSAFCLMFPKRIWEEAGKFDEDFFLYGEDSEFSRRAKHTLGCRLLWRKDVYVHHYKARSVMKAISDGEFDYEKVRADAEALCHEKYAAVGVKGV